MSQRRRYFLLACLVPIVFTTGRLASGGWDFSYFISAGDKNTNPQEHPYDIKILKDSDGYDGQYFYHLALKPWTTHDYEFGIDNALAYRKQRILYPVVSYLLALGQPEWVPTTMVLVNLLAVLLLFYVIFNKL